MVSRHDVQTENGRRAGKELFRQAGKASGSRREGAQDGWQETEQSSTEVFCRSPQQDEHWQKRKKTRHGIHRAYSRHFLDNVITVNFRIVWQSICGGTGVILLEGDE